MILIIGATSFIGLYTSKAFIDAGYKVVGTGRNLLSGRILKDFGVNFIELDITKESDFEKLPTEEVDGVILLAGLLPANSKADLKTTENAADYFWVNVIGTINVLEYCRRNNFKKVIGACSYGDVSNTWGSGRIITEDEPRSFSFTGDHASYIISKNAANDMMEYYNQQHRMQCAVFRFPQVYGVCPHNIGYFLVDGKPRISGTGNFIRKAKIGENIELWGNPRVAKDIVYVKDVAQAYIKALASDKTRGLYNITGHMQVTLEDQAKAVIKVFGNENSKIIYRPEKISYDRPPYLYSIDKAKRDFGYSPQYTDFVKIMEDYKIELESGRWNEWINSRSN
ncbi:MAG: NAD(P)-dependent oxidoreductase [Selenomonadaceae bacterium]|nr:NAD(P)-dependent oxidoreductase [Selenomonadaceae bacterium]